MLGWWRQWREAVARRRRSDRALVRIVGLLQENEQQLQDVLVGLHQVAAEAGLLAAQGTQGDEEEETDA